MIRAVLSRMVCGSSLRLLALCAALIGICTGITSSVTAPATAGAASEDRKQPMKFGWVACEPGCGGFISAVGIVTGDTPKDFDDFAHGRKLDGATVVLDSSGGSVNDAIALGRRWRTMKLATTVGTTYASQTYASQAVGGARLAVEPHAYCESMCVFLLLSGTKRAVPAGAHVRVHQIWMGDRAEDARAASYTAQDLTIVERDIGRLAKYTFDMGGTGDLLSLALSVAPWEDLHELSPRELADTNLVTTEAVADLLPLVTGSLGRIADSKILDSKTADSKTATAKPMPERFEARPAAQADAARPTQTAEAMPTGGLAQPATPGH